MRYRQYLKQHVTMNLYEEGASDGLEIQRILLYQPYSDTRGWADAEVTPMAKN